jgi:hypothetical protein
MVNTTSAPSCAQPASTEKTNARFALIGSPRRARRACQPQALRQVPPPTLPGHVSPSKHRPAQRQEHGERRQRACETALVARLGRQAVRRVAALRQARLQGRALQRLEHVRQGQVVAPRHVGAEQARAARAHLTLQLRRGEPPVRTRAPAAAPSVSPRRPAGEGGAPNGQHEGQAEARERGRDQEQPAARQVGRDVRFRHAALRCADRQVATDTVAVVRVAVLRPVFPEVRKCGRRTNGTHAGPTCGDYCFPLPPWISSPTLAHISHSIIDRPAGRPASQPGHPRTNSKSWGRRGLQRHAARIRLPIRRRRAVGLRRRGHLRERALAPRAVGAEAALRVPLLRSGFGLLA